MRFLLLSLLFHDAFAVGVVECGSKGGGAGHCVMSATACDHTLNSDECQTSAPADVVWWDKSLTVANDDAINCGLDANPLVTSSTTLDGVYMDVDNYKNYELKYLYVAKATGDTVGTESPSQGDLNKGFAALFNGELYSDALKTNLDAIVGADDATGETNVLCVDASRNNAGALTPEQSVCKPYITASDTGKRCQGGVLLDTTDSLDHNTVGDGAKKCFHLPWDVDYKVAKACATTETCDRFIEGSDADSKPDSQCVETTKIMSAYTAATVTVNHCMTWSTAGSDDKYRHISKTYGSQKCAITEFCNEFAHSGNSPADLVCLPSIIGTSAKSAARQPGAAQSATVAALKWCLSATPKVGAKQCATTEVCNPYSSDFDKLCINKTETTIAGSMAFGAVGADPPAANDKRGYCIGENATGSVCPAKHVCNYAGGNQVGDVDGGEVCLPHTNLLGEIADTAAWTAAAQRKVDGALTKYCLATDGTMYSSKVCATTEKCNPHASDTTNICIKAITVLNHGDIAPAAAEVVADSVTACIGKSYWKQCASEDGDTKEVCNEGASALTDVCIPTADCINPELPMEAFREAGVEAAEDQKWCFATDGAAKCGLDTICNPSGSDGGTASAAICADATKSVAHGEAATDELIHCYGNLGNAVLAADDSEEGFLCDQGKGEFIDPKSKMDPRSKNETPDPLPDGEIAVEVCFGKDKVEKCDVGVYCNSMGTETGCADAACTTKNICITEESLIAGGEQWVEEGKSVCLNADATAGEECSTEKMYCDQTEGVCSAEEIATTDEPSNESEGGAASGCAAQSLAAAAVVAILSA